MSKTQGWLDKPLNQVAEIIMGQSPDSKYYSEHEIGMPFLQGCAEFTDKYPIVKQYCSQPKKIGKKGSILFSVRAPVGKINLADQDYIIGRGLAAINGSEIVQGYLEQSLKFSEEQFKKASQGSTFKAINSSELAKWIITYPTNIQEQAKIAAILSTIDKAIEQTEAIIAKQQRIKAGLMQDLLTRGIDEHGNIRTEETHEFKDSPLGRIPAEWEVCRLENLTSKIVDGVHHTPTYVEEGVPFIVVSDLTQQSEISFRNTRFISYTDHQKYCKRADPKSGDVLITKDGTLGVARIVGKNVPEFSIFVSVALLRPIPSKCLPELIWSFFESSDFKIQLGGLSAGTGLAHIHLEHFRQFLLCRPSIKEQTKIFNVIHIHGKNLATYKKQLKKLKKIKTGLMQDLLTGKVRVTDLGDQQDPNA